MVSKTHTLAGRRISGALLVVVTALVLAGCGAGSPPPEQAADSFALAQNLEIWSVAFQGSAHVKGTLSTGCAQQAKNRWRCVTRATSSGKTKTIGWTEASLTGKNIRLRSKSKPSVLFAGTLTDINLKTFPRHEGATPDGQQAGQLTYYYSTPKTLKRIEASPSDQAKGLAYWRKLKAILSNPSNFKITSFGNVKAHR